VFRSTLSSTVLVLTVTVATSCRTAAPAGDATRAPACPAEKQAPIQATPAFAPVEASPRSAPLGTTTKRLPLIIDGDPGLDDALAIGIAVSRPEIELLAVTTVGGNTDVNNCTQNALRLLHAFGRDDVPVAQGAASPLHGSPVRAATVHGVTGIGNTQLPPATASARPEGAVELIAHVLQEHAGPVTIAAIGPLTNIALLLQRDPKLATKIAHIAVMGGAIGEGNITASAEFNIYSDPEAADVVFRSGIPITMIGLDTTQNAVVDGSTTQRLRALGTRSGKLAAELIQFELDRGVELMGKAEATVHDPVVIAHLAVPDLVAIARYHVTVDATQGPARGRTVCDAARFRLDRDGLTPNADVGIQLPRKRFNDVLVDAFRHLP
jgi:inosine-uridine nucleoside N-ribohydrolase